MKKYIEIEMEIYQLQPQDILAANGSNEDSATPGGGDQELPFAPFFI